MNNSYLDNSNDNALSILITAYGALYSWQIWAYVCYGQLSYL